MDVGINKALQMKPARAGEGRGLGFRVGVWG